MSDLFNVCYDPYLKTVDSLANMLGSTPINVHKAIDYTLITVTVTSVALSIFVSLKFLALAGVCLLWGYIVEKAMIKRLDETRNEIIKYIEGSGQVINAAITGMTNQIKKMAPST